MPRGEGNEKNSYIETRESQPVSFSFIPPRKRENKESFGQAFTKACGCRAESCNMKNKTPETINTVSSVILL